MKRFTSLTAAVFASMLLFGCGGAELEMRNQELSKAREAAKHAEAQLQEMKAQLESERGDKIRIEEQLRILNQQMREVREREQAQAQQLEAARAEAAKRRAEREGGAAGGGSDDGKSRVELLGAKAMAEYKAARLSEALEKAKKEIEEKNAKVAELIREVAGREERLVALTKELDESKTSAVRSGEALNARIDELTKQVEALTVESRESKRVAEEKGGLLDSFKTALMDARQLKAKAEADTEAVKAQLAEVSRNLAESQGQAQACVQENGALKAELEKRAAEIARVQAETEAARSEIAAFQVQGEKARVELLTLQADLEAARRDKDSFHQEAAKLSLELDSRAKEATALRHRVAELTARVEGLEKDLSAHAAATPSSVDQILGKPAAGTEQPQVAPETQDEPKRPQQPVPLY
jgi:chromosome segregation ATPase